MADKLKPCPFCGGEAKVRRSEFGYKAFCDKPFCCWMGTFRTEQEAIAAWNQRAERTCKNEYEHANSTWWFECSLCGAITSTEWKYIGSDMPNYCPNCGAKCIDGDA